MPSNSILVSRSSNALQCPFLRSSALNARSQFAVTECSWFHKTHSLDAPTYTLPCPVATATVPLTERSLMQVAPRAKS